MEIEINSNQHKISNNKLRYYFNDLTKFENNNVSLTECIFYSYFENIKSNYSMKVKKDGGFYNIDFINSQLEISDINNILQDNLIKFNLQTEDETPKIQNISDINTYSVLISIEKGFELHIDKNFQKILGFDHRILKYTMQRSNVTPQVNKLNYIKIFLNIVDNKIEENYLIKVFVQSSVGNLNLYSQNSIYKRKNILNTQFEFIEATFLNENNEIIELKDFFSISLFIEYLYIMPMEKLCKIEEKLKKEHIDIKSRYVKLKRCKYALLILKTTLLSLSIGLSFLNPLIIIASSTVPIIDSIMSITDKDKEVSHLKIQKDIINQIIKEMQMKKFTIENDDEAKKYILEVYGKVETFLDI